MKIDKIIETIKVAAAEVEWNYPLDYTTALDEAAELLEKQVPKEPLEIVEKVTNWKSWMCPICGYMWNLRYNYCHNCGQRINWEEKDD